MKCSNIQSSSREYEYDEFNRIAITNENGKVLWTYAYYPSGRLKTLQRNGKKWLEMESEIKNEKEYVSIVNSKGAQSKKIYSIDDGTLLEETNPLGESVKYEYDPVGQLAGWTQKDGDAVSFKYDERGKLVFQENEVDQTIERVYDE